MTRRRGRARGPDPPTRPTPPGPQRHRPEARPAREGHGTGRARFRDSGGPHARSADHPQRRADWTTRRRQGGFGTRRSRGPAQEKLIDVHQCVKHGGSCPVEVEPDPTSSGGRGPGWSRPRGRTGRAPVGFPSQIQPPYRSFPPRKASTQCGCGSGLSGRGHHLPPGTFLLDRVTERLRRGGTSVFPGSRGHPPRPIAGNLFPNTNGPAAQTV